MICFKVGENMIDTNSKKYIMDNLPELTEEDYREINALFPAYLFFKDKPQEECIECYCSACREQYNYEYTQRTETQQHYDFLQIRHNEKIVCPKCGKVVTAKEIYKAKQCISLKTWRRTVIIKQISENEVYLIGYECKKDYSYYRIRLALLQTRCIEITEQLLVLILSVGGGPQQLVQSKKSAVASAPFSVMVCLTTASTTTSVGFARFVS